MSGRQAADAIVARILDLVQARHGNVSSEEAAKMLGKSKRRLRYVFRSNTGDNLRNTRFEAKLTQARDLVWNSSLTIPEIADLFNYSRRTKFDDSYKRVFGITPAADRSRHHGSDTQQKKD